MRIEDQAFPYTTSVSDFEDELPTPTEPPGSQDSIASIARTWLQMLAISERPTRDMRRPSVHLGHENAEHELARREHEHEHEVHE